MSFPFPGHSCPVSIFARLFSIYLVSLGVAAVPLGLVDILAQPLPVRTRVPESSFRRFKGLLVFLELDVSINANNKKDVGGFE